MRQSASPAASRFAPSCAGPSIWATSCTAQAAAFPLQDYQGGSVELMVESNLAIYEITLGEHPEFKIPYFGFRGVPIAVDIQRVVATGITPVLDIGLAGRHGGQIGAGRFRAPAECFRAAANAYVERYAR